MELRQRNAGMIGDVAQTDIAPVLFRSKAERRVDNPIPYGLWFLCHKQSLRRLKAYSNHLRLETRQESWKEPSTQSIEMTQGLCDYSGTKPVTRRRRIARASFPKSLYENTAV